MRCTGRSAAPCATPAASVRRRRLLQAGVACREPVADVQDVEALEAGASFDSEATEVVAPLPWSASFAAHFRRHYWQRRPLVLRGLMPASWSPLMPSELERLACEPGANSRLLRRTGGARPWEQLRGPLDAATLASLPRDGPQSSSWILLVNALDRVTDGDGLLTHVGEALAPSLWRLDDLQASVAAGAGATVGPHTDDHDALLVQSLGAKRWDVCADPKWHHPGAREPGGSGTLAAFVPSLSVVLAPGDALYIPPRVAHGGVATGPGVTYSVGFISPTKPDVLAAVSLAASQQMGGAFVNARVTFRAPSEDESRLARAAADCRDGGGDDTPLRPGTLCGSEVRAFAAAAAAAASDFAVAGVALACLASARRPGSLPPVPPTWAPDGAQPTWAQLLARVGAGGRLERHGGSRFALLPGPPAARLFAAGVPWTVAPGAVAAAVAEEVAACRVMRWSRLRELGVPTHGKGRDAGGGGDEDGARAAADMLLAFVCDGLLLAVPGEGEAP